MGTKKLLSLNLAKRWPGIIIILMLLVIMVFALKPYSAQEIDKHDSLEKFTTYLDQRVTSLMRDYAIPGVNIALIKKGETIWSRAYGYADLEKGRKMTTDTYCRVESISKSVTAWGVMKLVEQGEIELDQPVTKYIKNWEFPESPFPEEKITIRQLLSNSSGMPLGPIGVHYSPQEDVPSLEETLSRHAVLQQEPGISYSYSNTGFALLELLIEEVTGRDFAEYMAKEVLIPLGMHHSSFSWSEEFDPAVPNGYDLNGNPIPVYVYPDKAAGGLFATVEDIATFASAGMVDHTEQNVLNSQSINEIYSPSIELSGYYRLVFDTYGFGHFIEILPGGQKAVSHGGQGSGWMTHFHSVPETGDGIVILTNSQRSWPFIAYILNDWAQWSGFSSVGMVQIVRGTRMLWMFIGLLLLLSLWQIWRLGRGYIAGKRLFAPLSKKSRLWRLAQAGLFAALVFILLWAVNQEYLFIYSVFPIASNWLGVSIIVCALALMLSALFPVTT